MALGNWAYFSLNEKSEHTSGTLHSEFGVQVETYKNWLYVGDEKAWDEKSGSAKPTVMEIHEGDLLYKDVQIVARRGPKNGIYFVACSPCYCPKQIMVGIGVYGYNNSNWVGIEIADKQFLHDLFQNHFENEIFRQIKII